MTRLIFSTFPCLELDTGERWLLADKSIDCDSAAHARMVAYAWIMVVVFCVGVPGGCFLLLWRQRDKIMASEDKRKEDKSLNSIRSLFENYKPEHWYWEPVEMTRRIFMTGFLVVLARGSFAQIVVCQGVSIVALTMLKTRSPFLRGNDNLVAEAMYTQIIITLLLCVLVKSSAEVGDEGELGSGTIDALLVSTQLLFAPLLLYKKLKGDRAQEGGALAAIVPLGGGEGAVSLAEKLTLAEARASEADALRSRLNEAEDELRRLKQE
ncbi:hypothetical protein TeGR_g8964 [Tetraparma gracilis]|uniref:TRP C-terminal domain-containing protein n=1 Tax=Tetraparma gracilis TaxID=2962635 RepID=A0ABQ6MGR0_9STRA|nr:hypothetical protein TeGR_g8964 [Tetraparma gracilis]